MIWILRVVIKQEANSRDNVVPAFDCVLLDEKYRFCNDNCFNVNNLFWYLDAY